MIFPDPLAAEIDPGLSFPAGLPGDHAAAYPVPGLQDDHRRCLVQLHDFPRRHKSGKSSTYDDDISHAHPYRVGGQFSGLS
jgi:hypothetical protein